MKKVIFITILSFIVTMALSSCTKESLENNSFTRNLLSSERSNLPDVIDLLDMLKAPTDGYIAFFSVGSYGSQNYRGPEVTLNGYMYDKNGQRRDIGDLAFGSGTFTADASNQYRFTDLSNGLSYFGAPTTIGFEGSTEFNIPGVSSNFYVPKLMTLTAPAYSNQTPLAPNLNLQWEADPLNTNGVGIMIYYNQKEAFNIVQKFTEPSVKTLKHVQDNGSYTITADDLAGIPKDAFVDVVIGRGNYQRVPLGNDYNVGLVSFSVVSHYFVMQ
jgi:hypothetical protein